MAAKNVSKISKASKVSKVSTGRPLTLAERSVVESAKTWAAHVRNRPDVRRSWVDRLLLAAVDRLLKSEARPIALPKGPKGSAYRDVAKRLDAERARAKEKLDAKARRGRTSSAASATTRRSEKATKVAKAARGAKRSGKATKNTKKRGGRRAKARRREAREARDG